MPDDPRDLLQRSAARPRGEPDLGALRARAGRRRAVRRAGAGLAAVAVLGLGAAGALTLDGPGGDEVVLQQPGGSGASPTATPAPTPSSSASPATPTPATPEPDAAFDGDADPYERPATPGELAVLSEVRTGSHDGYDRVVWEFAQGDRPHLWVEYVDQPTQSGSGNPVEVAGEAHLEVTAGGARDVSAQHFMPDVAGYDGPERVEGRGGAIQEVVALGDFEATMRWAVGLDRERPFRVTVLRDPLRLVVDVASGEAGSPQR